jgi:hypothetical protein
MSGETKTLKQIQAAEAVIRDVMALLETFHPRWDGRKTEARFICAAMMFTHKRLQEVRSELTAAYYRAAMSPDKTTIVSKEAFEDVRQFRTLGPAQLSNLLKNRRFQRRLQETEETADEATMAEGVGAVNVSVVP